MKTQAIILTAILLLSCVTSQAGKVGDALANALAPWDQRADAMLKKMLDGESGPTISSTIQNTTHPTGDKPKLDSYSIRHVGDQLSVRIDVAWKGGITKTRYVTRVVWEFDKTKHIKASVTDDGAPVKATKENLKKLDEYFRTEVYAVLSDNLKK